MKTPDFFLKRSFIAYLLLPGAAVYYVISKFVYLWRKVFQKSSKRPVICIGNILAGGVGKTPIVMELAKHLGSPVVMRGYKKTRASGDMGDEAKMLKKAGISVLVGDRKKNVGTLNKRKDKTPIVMDDGFQNPGVKKDVSILVFDENIGVGNGFVLPAGPLREPMCAVKRADAIIIIRNRESGIRNPQLLKLKNYNRPIFYATNETIMPKIKEHFIAFAGIGYPKKFFDCLYPAPVDVKSFPDHYRYKKSDLNKLFMAAHAEAADLITTEKDWVRLPKDAAKKIKVAKLKTTIEPAFWRWLNENI